MTGQQTFLLQRVQPAMVGLIDGSLSTLAPIFSVAIVTHKPHFAFIAGVAAAFGAGVSMAFSEGLSDTGELTGRGRPLVRGTITGVGTFIGGILHTLPFLIPILTKGGVVPPKVARALGTAMWGYDLTGGLRAAAALAQPHTNSRSPRARHSPPNS
jgi:hypothetical protein